MWKIFFLNFERKLRKNLLPGRKHICKNKVIQDQNHGFLNIFQGHIWENFPGPKSRILENILKDILENNTVCFLVFFFQGLGGRTIWFCLLFLRKPQKIMDVFKHILKSSRTKILYLLTYFQWHLWERSSSTKISEAFRFLCYFFFQGLGEQPSSFFNIFKEISEKHDLRKINEKIRVI